MVHSCPEGRLKKKALPPGFELVHLYKDGQSLAVPHSMAPAYQADVLRRHQEALRQQAEKLAAEPDDGAQMTVDAEVPAPVAAEASVTAPGMVRVIPDWGASCHR